MMVRDVIAAQLDTTPQALRDELLATPQGKAFVEDLPSAATSTLLGILGDASALVDFLGLENAKKDLIERRVASAIIEIYVELDLRIPRRVQPKPSAVSPEPES